MYKCFPCIWTLTELSIINRKDYHLCNKLCGYNCIWSLNTETFSACTLLHVKTAPAFVSCIIISFVPPEAAFLFYLDEQKLCCLLKIALSSISHFVSSGIWVSRMLVMHSIFHEYPTGFLCGSGEFQMLWFKRSSLMKTYSLQNTSVITTVQNMFAANSKMKTTVSRIQRWARNGKMIV